MLFALGEYDLALELWTSISPEKAFGKDNKKDENLKISRKKVIGIEKLKLKRLI